MIRAFLDKFLLISANPKTFNFKEYMKTIESGKWYDKFVFGISEHEKDFLIVNPVEQPGALFFGGMGSGKSTGMKFSVITRFISNSEHDVYILMDPQKGMTDYKTMFPYRGNVALALNDASKIIALVDMLYEECMARKEAFSKVQANNGFEYERIMRKKNPNYHLARIFVCFEEFHAIINSEALKFAYKCDNEGTAAYKFKQLLKISRSYFFFFALANQRASSDDTPSALKAGITTFLGFRVNNPGDAAVANLPLAADIPSNLRGRCVTENGYMQFPFLPDDAAEVLLKKYYRPLKGEMMKYKIDDFHKALEGEGNEGLVLIKPFKEILVQLYGVSPNDVCMRYLKTFNFEVEKQSNAALAVQLIAVRDGKRYAVMCVTQRLQTSDKSLEAFKAGAQILDCDHAIIMSNEAISTSVQSTLTNKMKFDSGILVDGEDLSRMSEVLDNRSRLEVEGNFENLYDRLVLAQKPEAEVVDDSDDTEDEDDDDQAPDLSAIREQLRRGK